VSDRLEPAAKLAAITIDVDSLRHYRAIHGLPEETLDDDPIYTIAMPRFWSLIEEARVPATLFLIGADAPEHAEVFAPVLATGSEVANHSWSHDYRLITLGDAEIAADLAHGDRALVPLNGGRPIAGFRAPGYNVSASLIHAALALGYTYDSSLLPSPAYFAARAAAISAHAAAGRRSRSLRGNPRQFLGPLDPYHADPDRPWRALAASPLVELPIACDPIARLPLIGTSWALAPRLVQRAMLAAARKLSCINFEMHAIDLLDAGDHPALAPLARVQRDLRVPAEKKLGSFSRLFRALADSAEVLTLSAIASCFTRLPERARS